MLMKQVKEKQEDILMILLRDNKNKEILSSSLMDILEDQQFDISVSSIENSESRDNKSALKVNRYLETPQAQILQILDREQKQNVANKIKLESILRQVKSISEEAQKSECNISETRKNKVAFAISVIKKKIDSQREIFEKTRKKKEKELKQEK